MSRIAHEASFFREMARLHCPLLLLLEHDPSAPAALGATLSDLFSVGPLQSEAADFGHVEQSRLWWFHCTSPLTIPTALAVKHVAISHGEHGVRVAYTGKPVPKRIFFEHGYTKLCSDPFPSPLLCCLLRTTQSLGVT